MNKGFATNFHGVIRDIVFDSKLLRFNKPVQFRGVGIGREGGSLDWGWGGTDVLAGTISRGHVKATSTSTSERGGMVPQKPSSIIFDDLYDQMMSIPAEHYDRHTSCASTHHSMLTTTAMDAMAFGDSRRANSSHVQLPTEDNEFYADFSLSFSFRSYYPNGILFTLARLGQKADYQTKSGKPVFVLALVEGTVMLRMKMSDRHYVELRSSASRKLNDGMWHHVTAGRKKLSLWMNVDLKDRVENSKPKRRLALKKGIQAFVGGLPEDYAIFGGHSQSSAENEVVLGQNGGVSSSATFLPTLEGFKGCLRKFLLNERAIDFRSLRLPDGVGTCFTEIEKGSYFSGVDSFAVYDDAFNIGLKADISFDFRTSKQSGVLLAMSNGSAAGAPSLSIELTTDGAIVASADLGGGGSGGLFRARKAFNSAFELCDGRWHSVRVHYTTNAISLKVDRAEVVYGFNEAKNGNNNGGGSTAPFTAAPLYIGGLPELAPSGSLLGRDSFAGCLRNVEVNEQRKDWLSDVTLYGVVPNACPAPAYGSSE